MNTESDSRRWKLTAKHNGYRYMPGRPMHTRSVIFAPGELQVLDEVDRDGFCGKVRYHIHPGIKLAIAKTGRSGSFFFPDGSEAKWTSDADKISVENNEYAWEFGSKIPIKTLVLHQYKRNDSVLRVNW